MARLEIDDLLRAMAESARDNERIGTHAQGAASAPVDAATLDAYRRGELDAAAAEAVERRLARDPAARAALAVAAGLPADPPDAVRAAVLASLPAPPRPGTARGARRLWSLVAAAVFVLMIFSLQVFDRERRPLPQIDAWYDINTEVRGNGGGEIRREEGDFRIAVEADQPFTIYEAPTWEAEEGIDVGIYRRHGSRIERIDGSELVLRDVTENAESGRFVIGRPGDVVGDEPGIERSLWLVVGWKGDLPATISAAVELDDAAVEALLAAGGRRAPKRFAVTITGDSETDS